MPSIIMGLVFSMGLLFPAVVIIALISSIKRIQIPRTIKQLSQEYPTDVISKWKPIYLRSLDILITVGFLFLVTWVFIQEHSGVLLIFGGLYLGGVTYGALLGSKARKILQNQAFAASLPLPPQDMNEPLNPGIKTYSQKMIILEYIIFGVLVIASAHIAITHINGSVGASFWKTSIGIKMSLLGCLISILIGFIVKRVFKVPRFALSMSITLVSLIVGYYGNKHFGPWSKEIKIKNDLTSYYSDSAFKRRTASLADISLLFTDDFKLFNKSDFIYCANGYNESIIIILWRLENRGFDNILEDMDNKIRLSREIERGLINHVDIYGMREVRVIGGQKWNIQKQQQFKRKGVLPVKLIKLDLYHDNVNYNVIIACQHDFPKITDPIIEKIINSIEVSPKTIKLNVGRVYRSPF